MISKNTVERLLTFTAGSGATLAFLHFRGVEGLDGYFFWVIGAFLLASLASAFFRWREHDERIATLNGNQHG